MANCKECIHNNVCRKYEPISYSACSDFKDKSRFIELPCKVGDMVYVIDDNDIDESRVSSLTQKSDKSWKIRITSGFYKYSFEITIDKIDKKVFLTRDEAEKALKEREQNV